MNVRVSGKQFGIGEALPKQVRELLRSATGTHSGLAEPCRGFALPTKLLVQLKRYKGQVEDR
jgi:hypothetical protein